MQVSIFISKQVVFLFIYIVLIGHSTEDRSYGGTKTKIPPESNSDLLQCLPSFIKELFTPPQQSEKEDQQSKRTLALYRNAKCITQRARKSPTLVACFATLFDNLAKYPLQDGSEEQKTARKKLNETAICISNEINASREKSNLKEILHSIREKKLLESEEPEDEFAPLMTKRLLGCLVFHFNATFSFKLPGAIKEQDKLRNYELRWTSGCIGFASDIAKKSLSHLANIFNMIVHATLTEDLYRNAKFLASEASQDLGRNMSINGSRMISSFVEKVFDPEPKDPDVKITRTTFDGVKVIIHQPTRPSSKLLPGLVFFHGGGWVYRDADTYLRQTVYLSKKLGAVVVSVDYRRCPEHCFPVPVDDCLKATKYFMKNSRRFNVSSRRIGLIGDSAGGNMAAVISLMLRDQKYRKPKTQVLIYPGLQMFDFNLPSYQQNKEMYGLKKTEVIYFRIIYTNINNSFTETLLNNRHVCEDMKKSKYASYIDLNAIPEEYRKGYIRNWTSCDPVVAESVKPIMLNSYIFPLMADDLKKLPNALIITGELDVLRDDGLMYGSRLRKAGILLEEHVIKGGFHGSINLLNYAKIGKDVFNIIIKYLKKNL